VSSIAGHRFTQASLHHGTLKHQAKHFFYASGWKKFELAWDFLIRAKQLTRGDAVAGRRPLAGDQRDGTRV